MILRSVPALLLMIALVALAGCGDDETGGGSAVALTGELRYVRSGGFDGDRKELTVQPDGAARLISRRAGERTFTVEDAALDALAAEANGLEETSVVAPKPAPDAFVYTVVYAGATARTDDPTLKSSGLAPLIAELEKILASQAG